MTNDWHALYDEVKLLGDFGSDAQVAESLGLTRAQISAWRTGKSELGQDTLRSAVLSLLPHRNRALLEEQHLALVARVSRGRLALLESSADAKVNTPYANGLLAALPAEDQGRI
jgi:transcriptional regulator with XRE-family HTH domain